MGWRGAVVIRNVERPPRWVAVIVGVSTKINVNLGTSGEVVDWRLLPNVVGPGAGKEGGGLSFSFFKGGRHPSVYSVYVSGEFYIFWV